MTPSTILSPHFDDAILSCWHVLDGASDVDVINLFTGSPNSHPGPYWWDALTGATDSVRRIRERQEEDRTALSLVNRRAMNLGFLDEQYRAGEQAVTPLVDKLGQQLEPGAVVYAPAGINRLADHLVVRNAALALREAGFRICLYADLPHALLFGWPSWVTGRAADPLLQVEGFWGNAFSDVEPPLDSLVRHAHELSSDVRRRKLVAIRAYRTQFPALDTIPLRPLADPETLRFEVTWELPT